MQMLMAKIWKFINRLYSAMDVRLVFGYRLGEENRWAEFKFRPRLFCLHRTNGLGKGMHPSCYGYELNNTADRNIFPREEILEKENSEHNIKNSEHWGFYHWSGNQSWRRVIQSSNPVWSEMSFVRLSCHGHTSLLLQLQYMLYRNDPNGL